LFFDIEIDFNFLCRIGIHSWANWDEGTEGQITTPYMGKYPVLLQERHCTKCNKKERQYIKYKETK
jgi:hypothetical protein